MMLISHTCQVALKSVAQIAGNGQSCINVKELSVKINENPHTIAKVLQTLVKAGLLNSITGPSGGFYLTEKQIHAKLISIVDIVDGKDILGNCVLGLNRCSSSHPCPIHSKFIKARKEISNVFGETRIGELTPGLKQGKFFLK